MTERKTDNAVTDAVVLHAPYGVLVLDSSLQISGINPAACTIFGLDNGGDWIGKPIETLMDTAFFARAAETGGAVEEPCVYLAPYNRYVEQKTVFCDGKLLCYMRDITGEELARQRREQTMRENVQTTDRVIDKQMRTVQEIASLLGETAAETKIALVKLKDSLNEEE